MATQTDELLYDVKDKIATLTLNRPEKMNAFTGPMIDLWAWALNEAQHDPDVNVVVVTGSGKAFCAGGDVPAWRRASPRRWTARTGSGKASTACPRRWSRWTSPSSP